MARRARSIFSPRLQECDRGGAAPVRAGSAGSTGPERAAGLISGHLSLAEIAAAVGFAGQGAFRHHVPPLHRHGPAAANRQNAVASGKPQDQNKLARQARESQARPALHDTACNDHRAGHAAYLASATQFAQLYPISGLCFLVTDVERAIAFCVGKAWDSSCGAARGLRRLQGRRADAWRCGRSGTSPAKLPGLRQSG